MIKKYKTEARPEPKNNIWEQNIGKKIYICERPHYRNKKLEVELLTKGFENESLLLFNKVLPFFFDKEGRWWAHPSLCSQGMLQLFIKEPMLYLRTIAHKVQTTKDIIQTLKELEPDLYTDNVEKLATNFKRLSDCFVRFYSYHFITYIVFDEIVLRFRHVLEKFLPKNEANTYLSEFLRAEITKEALKVGAIGDSLTNMRDIFYSDSKPVIFYKEPKLFFESEYDNKVITKLYESNPSPRFLQEFFSLRIITPVSIQISEEGQYVESKMLLPMFKITLEKIGSLFMKEGLLRDNQDIRDLTKGEITEKIGIVLSKLKKMRVIAKGLGVSKGKVQGKVRIIKHLDDHAKFKQGDILVTRLTDPTMVVLMAKAAGIICDIGSLTSHPSIIARELGIPCIVSAQCIKTGKAITEILKDGQEVHMCGSTGEIHLIEKPKWALRWQ